MNMGIRSLQTLHGNMEMDLFSQSNYQLFSLKVWTISPSFSLSPCLSYALSVYPPLELQN